jgi:hypothetical protein
MTQQERVDRAQLARAEVEGAVFGDARLTRRLGSIVEMLAKNPSKSLPEAAGDEAALEGVYRFLNNEKVTPQAVLAPHIARTYRRASEQKRVLAVFDTTELRFGGERKGLGYLTHEKGRGHAQSV